MQALQRNNVNVFGQGQTAMVFAHGFGCDQNMWRWVTPAFAQDYRIVLFDHVGAGGSDVRAYERGKYSSLGGFSRQDIEALLESLESNYLGWSSAMAPAIMGNADRPELGQELTNSFCRTDPQIAQHFARVTFLSDNRADLSKLRTPSLILQCSQDVIAPLAVGEYLHRNLPHSQLHVLRATGHCPNLSAPEETAAAMRAYLTQA
jgi:sigma-B regulation protein RsbQ